MALLLLLWLGDVAPGVDRKEVVEALLAQEVEQKRPERRNLDAKSN